MNPPAFPPEEPFVRREQLPLPRPYAAPRTPTERQLAEIWRDVLGMDRVGVEDTYVDLGCDSFLAGVIFQRIAETFRVSLGLTVLVDAPTIAQLALKIDALSYT